MSISADVGSSTSGIDVQAVVDRIMYAERAPQRLMQAQQKLLESRSTALRDIQSKLDALESAIDDLNDVSGALNARKATSSRNDLLTATAGSGATSGIHTITVRSLAKSSSYCSDPRSSSTAAIPTGSGFDLSIGAGAAVQIRFDAAHATLGSAADYINGLGLGVRANVISDANGSRLALTSKDPGAAGNITVTNDTTGLNLVRTATGTNAQLTIDGVDVESSANSVSGVLPGVTLNLSAAAPDTELVLTVGADTTRAHAAVESFVRAWNTLVTGIGSQFTYDSVRKTSGVLAGDSSLRSLQDRLLRFMSHKLPDNGAYTTLRSVGVEMNNDGTFTVNDSVLESAISTGYDQFSRFFQASAGGFSSSFKTELMSLTDSVNGPVKINLSGIEASTRTITDSISDFEARMEQRETQLLAEYSRIDTLLRQFTATQSRISTQLSALSNNK
ncbi:MAG TPA: flagellar filament capping protein FliD [Clostridia bacterium]|nr:flagellar filament capping protein FliD [Clostridia bacterium]